MTHTWSQYQQAIFTHIETPKSGNLIVEAVAGSGKTTTIVEAVKRCKGSTVFLAFNKAIATELGSRGVNAKTFHGMTYSATLNYKKAQKVEQFKVRRLVDANFSKENHEIYGSFCAKLVGLGKQSGVGCIVNNEPGVWANIATHHDLEAESENFDFETALELTAKLLQWNNESSMVDFDDMLYFPVLFNIPLARFANVFVDEAQDTNAIQRELLRRVLSPVNSRLVAVGDPGQAIYGFRGADSGALDLLAAEFSAVTLPLSVSYRCASSIVALAQIYVGHIEAAPNAPVGLVSDPETWSVNDFVSSDIVVCRTTKPVIQLAYKMLKAHKPVRVLGREIGEGLISLIKRMKCQDLPTLRQALAQWGERETMAAQAKQDERKAESVSDKLDCIDCLIESLPAEATIQSLCGVIETIFSDAKNATTLCTIHKAKGLEAERVYWLNSSECPSKWAKRDWQKQQERNLCYVAITRAKRELSLIEMGGLV